MKNSAFSTFIISLIYESIRTNIRRWHAPMTHLLLLYYYYSIAIARLYNLKLNNTPTTNQAEVTPPDHHHNKEK